MAGRWPLAVRLLRAWILARGRGGRRSVRDGAGRAGRGKPGRPFGDRPPERRGRGETLRREAYPGPPRPACRLAGRSLEKRLSSRLGRRRLGVTGDTVQLPM